MKNVYYVLLLFATVLAGCTSEVNQENIEDVALEYSQEARNNFMAVMAGDIEYAGMISEELNSGTRAVAVESARLEIEERELLELGTRVVKDLEPYTESFIYSYPDIRKCDVIEAANEEGIPVNELEVYIGMILTDPIFEDCQVTRANRIWSVLGCIALGESVNSWMGMGSKYILKSIAKQAAKRFASQLLPGVGTAIAVGTAAVCIYDTW